MYRKVMAELKWDSPSKRDTFKTNLAKKLSNIPCHDENVVHGEDIEGNPHSSIDVRPESDADADDLYSHVKRAMDNIPGLTGRVTVHDCRHDEGPPFEECTINREYEV